MHIRDINVRTNLNVIEAGTDTTADTLYSWADKLQDNFDYIKRWFGSGILEGGDPEILVDTTNTGIIQFTSPIRALISGQQITETTNQFKVKFGGWQWSEFWEAAGKDFDDTEFGIGTWSYNPVYDGRFVYFFQHNWYYRYDTQKSENYWTDHSSAWENIQANRISSGSYQGAVIVGDYIYLAPSTTSVFVRYEIGDPFDAVSSWEQYPASQINYKDRNIGPTLTGVSFNQAFMGACYDGRYIYFAPYNQDEFMRFDHGKADRLGLSFSETDTTCWEIVDVASIRGTGVATTSQFVGCAYDPVSDCIYFGLGTHTNARFQGFLRYNRGIEKRIGARFPDATVWEHIKLRDVLGEEYTDAGEFMSGVVVKGRFVYFQPFANDYLVRYDTRKYWDATSAIHTDTTTGFEIILMPGLGTEIGQVDNWAEGQPAHDGKWIYFPGDNSERVNRLDSTAPWVLDAVRRRSVWTLANPTFWETIPTEILVSPGPRTTYTEGARQLSGVVRGGNHMYFQPADHIVGSVAVPMVRYEIGEDFKRGQDEPHLLTINRDGEIHPYRFKNFIGAAITSTVTEYNKRFTDSTTRAQLWVIVTDDQRKRISYLRDVRNVIPDTRKRITNFSFRGLVESTGELSRSGNRDGDAVLFFNPREAEHRSMWVWNSQVDPGPYSIHYWHPIIPETIAQYGFRDFQFEEADGNLQGIIGADTVSDVATFSAGSQIDWDEVDTRNIRINVKINETLNMRGNDIIHASSIDTTGDLKLRGDLQIDGTTVIYNSADTTTLIVTGSVHTLQTILEDGFFNTNRTLIRIGEIKIFEGNIKTGGSLDIIGNLHIRAIGGDHNRRGLINLVDILKHAYRHENWIAGDGTGADIIDATSLTGILADPQNCEWLGQSNPQEIASTAPDTNDVLMYSGGQWKPVSIGGTPLTFEEKMALYRLGIHPDRGDSERWRKLLKRTTSFERFGFEISTSPVTGVDLANGACFDGKYIYFTPWNSTEFIRYDTDEQFNEPNAWQGQLTFSSMTYAFGGNPCFDGRYIYFAPYNDERFVRFDTEGKRIYRDAISFEEDNVFQEVNNWQSIDMTRVFDEIFVKNLSGAFKGCVFDGRYVYYVPHRSDKFVRFDTRLGFLKNDQEVQIDDFFGRKKWDGADGLTYYLWETFDIEELTGIDSTMGFEDACFDGQYVYYGANKLNRLVRFNTRFLKDGREYQTTRTPFTDASAWDVIGLEIPYGKNPPDRGPFFPAITTDGKWVYYAPDSTSSGSGNPDATMLVRFNSNLPFGNANSWERIDIQEILVGRTGWKHRAFRSLLFDGQYIYYGPDKSNYLLRYNIDESFIDSTGWEFFEVPEIFNISLAGENRFSGGSYDGKYVYFAPMQADFVRFRGFDCGGKYGMR